ncbi:heme-dependent oxidative N-demethylase family protein [Mycolicibacterium sp.]|uniref:heme-dependent oxidative N-demethylase family protein n=1 Tax=Mycolicibacterium sp. TaxID=2320850 RepID=UPI0037C77AE5
MVSAADLMASFPFPYTADSYRYSTNIAPARGVVTTATGHWGQRVVDIDSEYTREVAERRRILAADPSRHAVLPHMRIAAWDTMVLLMTELATSYPATMSLTRDGETWHWRNELLDITQDFVIGAESSLPCDPLAFIAGQVQEDIVLLDQRDGDLFADAGVVTFAAGWSFGFDVGMTFLEIHGPVPRLRETGVITRAREFLMRLQPGDIYRRTNWSMTVGRRLDISTEAAPEWLPDRAHLDTVDDDTFGRLLHLRVEVQHVIRLPESGAICFLIRSYMLPLADIATVDEWRTRTAAVLAELPDDMAEYKGLSTYRDRAVSWLRSR